MEEIRRRAFGQMPDGETVTCLTLDSGALRCEILNLGGILRALWVRDRNGDWTDVVLGCDTPQDYLAVPDQMGAIVGRCANRIAHGQLTLNGTEIQLPRNSGEHHIHGGFEGFSRRIWTVEAQTGNRVVLRLDSRDGEEGYPGNMTVRVTYEAEGACLAIRYEAVSDRDTVCNLTSHSYFNLSGHSSGSAEAQKIAVFADHYTPTAPDGIPSGRIEPVEGTLMDLRKPAVMGMRANAGGKQLRHSRGFDHNYVLTGELGKLRPAAWAESPETGITMRIDTTLPGIQLYTANFLDEGRAGKDGAQYGSRHAFCMEAEFFPDAPHHENFPSIVLRAGETYRHETHLIFETQEI